MMSKEESAVVKIVYNRFIESEEEGIWTDLDNNLEMVGWLSDIELFRETQFKHTYHAEGIFKCNQKHEQQHCFAPTILDSVGIILDLYYETREMHPKNRYVLEYYLAMSEMKMIYRE